MEVLIYGSREIDILDVSISDILNAINKDFSLNYWNLLWIEAISVSNKFNILEIEENVNKKKNILNFNYKDLMIFNENISIYNELFLIGNYEKFYNPIHKTDADVFENNDIIIELIDNSFWIIKTKNVDLVNSLMELPGAKIE